MFERRIRDAFGTIANQTGATDDVTLWSHPGKVVRCVETSPGIGSDPTALRALRFYLSSIDSRVWQPSIVTVANQDGITGIFCAKQRKVLKAVPTGILFADATSSPYITIAASDQLDHVFEAAVRFLFDTKKILGLRLMVPTGEREEQNAAQIAASNGLDYSAINRDYHDRMPLPVSYTAFLRGLKRNSRKNLTKYRAKADEVALTLHSSIPLDAFSAAARDMLAANQVSNDRHTVMRGLRMTRYAEHPLLTGLQHKNGEWLSLGAGWFDNNQAWMFFILNRKQEFPGLSLSTVIRGHIIEHLIKKGTRDIVFWDGNKNFLKNSFAPIPTTVISIDSRSRVWKAGRILLSRISPSLPRRVVRELELISPSGR